MSDDSDDDLAIIFEKQGAYVHTTLLHPADLCESARFSFLVSFPAKNPATSPRHHAGPRRSIPAVGTAGVLKGLGVGLAPVRAQSDQLDTVISESAPPSFLA